MRPDPAGISHRRSSLGLTALDRLMDEPTVHLRPVRDSSNDELEQISSALHGMERVSGMDIVPFLTLVMNHLGAAPAEDPARALTADQEAVLSRAGSLVEQMPAPAERASTATAMEFVSLIGHSLTTKDVAALLGVSDGRIRQRATDRSLLSIRVGASLKFPDFQFPHGHEMPGWAPVARSFPEHTAPLAVASFVGRPSPDLVIDGEQVSPSDWLVGGGDPEVVIDLVTTAFRVHP